jgi:hypothetical protein
MSEPLANMWINWNLLQTESFRAVAALEKADVAMHAAVADIAETSRELRKKLQQAKSRPSRAEEPFIEAPTPEHSLPAAAMLNI